MRKRWLVSFRSDQMIPFIITLHHTQFRTRKKIGKINYQFRVFGFV